MKVIRKWKAFDVSPNNLSDMSPSFLTFQSLKTNRCSSSFSNEIYNSVRIWIKVQSPPDSHIFYHSCGLIYFAIIFGNVMQMVLTNFFFFLVWHQHFSKKEKQKKMFFLLRWGIRQTWMFPLLSHASLVHRASKNAYSAVLAYLTLGGRLDVRASYTM